MIPELEQLKRDAVPFRVFSVRSESLDEPSRSVRAIIATESRARVPDWERMEMVDEVLRMDGMIMPERGTFPVLDNHDRGSIKNILGRGDEVTIEADEATARLRFRETEDADEAFRGIRGGDITDVSVGYTNMEVTHVRAGEKREVNGREYDGPVNVVTKWRLNEVSLTPIGADSRARIRAAFEQISAGQAPVEKTNKEAAPMRFQLKDGRTLTSEELAGLRSDEIEIVAVIDGDGKSLPVAGSTTPTPDATRTEQVEPFHRSAKDMQDLLWYGRAFDVPTETLAVYIEGKRSVTEIREEIAKKLQTTHPVIPSGGGNASGGEDNNVRSLMDAIPDAIAVRASVVPRTGEVNVPNRGIVKHTLHARAAELSQLSLMQMIRGLLEAQGVRTGLKSNTELLRLAGGRSAGAANSTSQFATLLENTMNKIMLMGYNQAPTTWRSIASSRAASDLRQHNLYKRGNFGSLQEIGEGAEVPSIGLVDGKKETVTPKTFSNLYTITDDVFINDDMGAFQNIANDLGRAADETVNEWVYYALLSNPLMNEDGIALFDTATHKNLVTSGGTPPDKASFDAMFSSMAVQTGLNGKPLNLLPTTLVIPPALRGTTLEFLNSQQIVQTSNLVASNAYYQSVNPIIEPLLQTGVTVYSKTGALTVAGSSKAWIALASAQQIEGPVVAFYDGETPQIVTERPIELLGQQFRVTLRFGVSFADWRGLYQNDGDA